MVVEFACFAFGAVVSLLYAALLLFVFLVFIGPNSRKVGLALGTSCTTAVHTFLENPPHSSMFGTDNAAPFLSPLRREGLDLLPLSGLATSTCCTPRGDTDHWRRFRLRCSFSPLVVFTISCQPLLFSLVGAHARSRLGCDC